MYNKIARYVSMNIVPYRMIHSIVLCNVLCIWPYGLVQDICMFWQHAGKYFEKILQGRGRCLASSQILRVDTSRFGIGA